jgi:hypothetical protein
MFKPQHERGIQRVQQLVVHKVHEFGPIKIKCMTCVPHRVYESVQLTGYSELREGKSFTTSTL